MTSNAINKDVWNTETPEEDASFLSRLVFYWVQPLFRRAAELNKDKEAVQQEDLIPLREDDHASVVEKRFVEGWNKYDDQSNSKKKGASANDTAATTPEEEAEELERRLKFAIWHTVGRRLMTAGVIKFFNTALQFSFPLLLNAILEFFEDTQLGVIPEDAKAGQEYKGYWLSALLLVAITSKAITESSYFLMANRAGWQVRTAISGAVYNKSLRLASAALHGTTLGEMVNLMQVDATKMEEFMMQVNVLWDGIFQIAGYMTILGTLIGWPCLMGLVIMCFAAPVMGKVMSRLFMQNRAMVKHTDQRVKTTNEALQGIRSVKMYTWEDSFAKAIGVYRDQELLCLRNVAYLRGFSRAYMSALPTVAAVISFVVYAYTTDDEIKASTLFAAMVAFDQIRFPLLFYPLALAQLVQAKVSLGRVSKFLGLPEVLTGEGYTRHQESDGNYPVVEMKDATVYWSDPKIPIPKPEKEESDVMKESTHSRKSTKSAKSSTDVDSLQITSHSDIPAEDGMVYPKAVVKDISMKLEAGELCAVVGRVGAGKSSLCASILNETVLSEGSVVTVRGSVAFCSQSAWILNQTVRDNILFGKAYDEERYKKVIKACQLEHDLELLEDGDMTEIGEKGINLSGGQKQRVSVARAAYSDADLIILDDPLSALDPEVAGKLFEECIVGHMKGKSRLLVTNQLQCLPKCDSVIALAKGKVVEQGTYDDLMNDERGEVKRLLNDLTKSTRTEKSESSANTKEEDSEGGAVPKENTEEKSKKEAKALTTKEEREIGAVKTQVYQKYIKAGGGYFTFAIVYFVFVLSAGVTLLSSLWVSIWTQDANYEKQTRAFYLGIYAMTAGLLGLVTFLRSFLLTKFGVRASRSMHRKLLSSVLNAPMSFFDTTPTGRILSRFSKDLYSVDGELTDFLDIFLFLTFNVVITMGTIVFVTPWFGIALVPLTFVYVRILNYFRLVSRETKRLESLSRSPVYSQFSETLGGLTTIRAYGESAKFVGNFEVLLDGNTRGTYSNKTADRWLALRLEIIGAIIAGLAAVFATHAIVSDGSTGQGETDNFASLAGLSLTYAIGITGALNFVVRMFAQVEAAMNACERVFHYSEHIPQEAPPTSDELEKQDPDLKTPSALAIAASGGKVEHPPQAWPDKGEIVLNNMLMRYRPETPLVLKGLNVKINGGERIGVVGRTGSGKSSLLLCLLRIVEPELADHDTTATTYEAPITVDGVDILRVGLRDLRSKLGIIPQSPVLFSGSIRSNLDPFNDYTDDQIWSALQRCGMYEAVSTMPGELDAPVAEYGENLSQGQRQLLCLGRALLRKCRILLLDEATSSVDYETDSEIQRTLREAFAGCTVLTIAHRVNTILDSDAILVMSDGIAKEYGPPQELLQDENSLFTDIVKHSEAESK